MPQHKSPDTLSDMCTKYMAAIVKRIGEQHSKEPNFIHSSLYESANSVFNSLPVSIIDDIIGEYHAIYPRGIESFFPVEFLVNHKASRLKFIFTDKISEEILSAQTVLQKIGSVGTSLTDLFISGSILCFSDYFIHFTICNLRNLRYLTLYNLKLDDSVLIAIGQSCKNLEYLCVSGWSVTDCGLKGLVPITAESTIPSQLKTVKLEYDRYHLPKITKYGVLHILLHLPKLQVINMPHLKDALLMLEQHSCHEMPFTLLLCEFNELEHKPFTTEFIALLGRLCPMIRDLSVVVTDSHTLSSLTRFNKLSTLKVCAMHASMNVFFKGLSPVLKIIGSTIKHLELCIADIDLSVIDMCCPALSVFDVSGVETFKVDSPPKRKMFPLLQVLKVFPKGENALSSNNLFHFLSGCLGLEHLYLCTCDGLDDDTLIKILLLNPMRTIEIIELTDISTITLNGLRHLVLSNTNLEKMHIFACSAVSASDIKSLRDFVIQTNLKLVIDFHGY